MPLALNLYLQCTRRAPHGARGLKFFLLGHKIRDGRSRPTRGAWIEIKTTRAAQSAGQSRPTRGAWIEMRLMM